MNRNQNQGSVIVDSRISVDFFRRKVGQQALMEARQAQQGLIRAMRIGRPGANFAAAEIMPLKAALNDAEWRANATLFEIELEDQANVA